MTTTKHKLKLSLVAFVFASSLSGLQAASVAVSIDQGSFTENAGSINLTTEGNADWWILATDRGNGSISPSNQKATNVGGEIVSLTFAGTTNETGNFPNAENNYSWSDGSPSLNGSQNNNFDRLVFNSGDTATLVVTVAQAGTYRLNYYTTVFDQSVSAVSTLLSDSTDGTATSIDTNALSKNYWSIDFTTDGPDTLTTVFTSNGNGSIFAHEAITLATVPEPSSTALLGLAGLALILHRRR